MDKLIIKASDDNPEIILDKENCLFKIEGKSLPEDVNTFYEPVLKWLKQYSTNPLKKTTLAFKFSYFNTASSKKILDILLILEEIIKKGAGILVKWYYPDYDEDMKEAGEEYSEMTDVPFEFIKY